MTPGELVLFLLHGLLLDLDARLEVPHRFRLMPACLLQSRRAFEDLHFLLPQSHVSASREHAQQHMQVK
jgi:hypothetical protein